MLHCVLPHEIGGHDTSQGDSGEEDPGDGPLPAGRRRPVPGRHQHGKSHGCRQEEEEDSDGRPEPDADVRRRGGLLPGLLRRLPGKGALPGGLLRPERGLHSLVPDLPGVRQLPPDGLKVHESPPEPGDGVALRQTLRFRGGAEAGGCRFLRLGLVPQLLQSFAPLDGGVALSVPEVLLHLPLEGLQPPELLLRLRQLPALGLEVLPLSADLLALRLPLRDAAGPVVSPAVQLAAQGVAGLGVGGPLLSGGDQGEDAALQLRAGTDAQVALADHGAALKDLPGDAQKGLPAARGGQLRDGLCRPGPAGGEGPHGGGLPPGLPEDGELAEAAGAVHPAGHGGAVPGGVAVLLRQDPGPVPLSAVDTIEHGRQQGTPGGLAALVGGFQDVEAVPQRQGLPLEPAEDGG